MAERLGRGDAARGAAVSPSPLPQGRRAGEAARLPAGCGPPGRPRTSRSYASIVRANVLTVFNLILAVAGLWAQLQSTAAMENGITADAYRYG